MATWKKLAYFDEVATLSNATPANVGTTASAGVATDASRSDHVHIIGTGAINASGLFAAGVVDANALGSNAVTTAKIADANVTTAKISIDNNLNMNKKQLTAAALDNQTADPTTPVAGQIYFKTGDTHAYLCTAA